MAAELNVITDALRDEGRKWRLLCDDMERIKLAAAQLTLAPSAWFIGDANVALHSQAYDGFHAFMVRILSQGAAEFDQLGAVLHTIADTYDEEDELIALDLNKVYSL